MSFSINYKGTSCRGTTFLYVCTTCQHEHEEQHAASEEPTVMCEASPEKGKARCEGICVKKPTVPALDADHHDSMRSYNIGWDTE